MPKPATIITMATPRQVSHIKFPRSRASKRKFAGELSIFVFMTNRLRAPKPTGIPKSIILKSKSQQSRVVKSA